MSYKGTKGASAQAKPKQLSTSHIKPIKSGNQEQVGLRPLDSMDFQYTEEKKPSAPKKKVQPKQEPPTPPNRRPVAPQKKTQPIKKPVQGKRSTQTQPVENKGFKRKRHGDMRPDEAEAIAREELAERGASKLSKHPYEMTTRELQELAKNSATPVRKRPENSLPPLTSSQTEMLLQQRQLTSGSSGMNMLIQKIVSDKNK